jgi:hypothetical protein
MATEKCLPCLYRIERHSSMRHFLCGGGGCFVSAQPKKRRDSKTSLSIRDFESTHWNASNLHRIDVRILPTLTEVTLVRNQHQEWMYCNAQRWHSASWIWFVVVPVCWCISALTHWELNVPQSALIEHTRKKNTATFPAKVTQKCIELNWNHEEMDSALTYSTINSAKNFY